MVAAVAAVAPGPMSDVGVRSSAGSEMGRWTWRSRGQCRACDASGQIRERAEAGREGVCRAGCGTRTEE